MKSFKDKHGANSAKLKLQFELHQYDYKIEISEEERSIEVEMIRSSIITTG
jgi:hypothetical protein